MSSGYDDREEDFDDDRPRDRQDIVEVAKNRVKGPAIALLVTGCLALLSSLSGIVNLFTMDKQFADVEQQWDNDPNLQPQQKKDMKEMLGNVKGVMKTVLPIVIISGTLTAILTILGSIKMLNLTSRGMARLGAVLSMIPLFSGCCLLGLPFGIWALIVLGKPEVKAGFAAVAGGGTEDYSSEFERP